MHSVSSTQWARWLLRPQAKHLKKASQTVRVQCTSSWGWVLTCFDFNISINFIYRQILSLLNNVGEKVCASSWNRLFCQVNMSVDGMFLATGPNEVNILLYSYSLAIQKSRKNYNNKRSWWTRLPLKRQQSIYCSSSTWPLKPLNP